MTSGSFLSFIRQTFIECLLCAQPYGINSSEVGGIEDIQLIEKTQERNDRYIEKHEVLSYEREI